MTTSIEERLDELRAELIKLDPLAPVPRALAESILSAANELRESVRALRAYVDEVKRTESESAERIHPEGLARLQLAMINRGVSNVVRIKAGSVVDAVRLACAEITFLRDRLEQAEAEAKRIKPICSGKP